VGTLLFLLISKVFGKHDLVDLVDVRLDVFALRVRTLLLGGLALLLLPFDLYFVLLFVFPLQLLFILFIFVELEQVLDGLPFSHWRGQVGEGVTEEDTVAAVVQDILTDHLRERLFFYFLLIELLDLHQVFFLHVEWLKPRLNEVLVLSFAVESYEVVHDAFELMKRQLLLTSGVLRLSFSLHLAHELPHDVVLFFLLSASRQFLRELDVILHLLQTLVDSKLDVHLLRQRNRLDRQVVFPSGLVVFRVGFLSFMN